MRKAPFLYSIVLVFVCLLFCACSGSCSGSSSTALETSEADQFVPRTVHYTQQGVLTSSGAINTVSVYTDSVSETEISADTHLEVLADNRVFTYNLGHWEVLAIRNNGGLSLVDFNNDGIDEIVLFLEVTGNGGTLAQVFAVREDGINLLCDLSDIDLSLEITYQNGFVVLIEQRKVGLSKEIRIPKEFPLEWFDESGKLVQESPLFLRDVKSVEIDEAETDELLGVVCRRSVYATNWLGDLEITFRYDAETKTLTPAKIIYIGSTGDDSVC